MNDDQTKDPMDGNTDMPTGGDAGDMGTGTPVTPTGNADMGEDTGTGAPVTPGNDNADMGGEGTTGDVADMGEGEEEKPEGDEPAGDDDGDKE